VNPKNQIEVGVEQRSTGAGWGTRGGGSLVAGSGVAERKAESRRGRRRRVAPSPVAPSEQGVLFRRWDTARAAAPTDYRRGEEEAMHGRAQGQAPARSATERSRSWWRWRGGRSGRRRRGRTGCPRLVAPPPGGLGWPPSPSPCPRPLNFLRS
jgi:hypothetical protein